MLPSPNIAIETEFLLLGQIAFEDWNAPDDCEAFRDL